LSILDKKIQPGTQADNNCHQHDYNKQLNHHKRTKYIVNKLRARFRPPLWSTFLLLSLSVLFISAGFWQLDRAEQKRALFQAFDQTMHQPPLDTLVDNSRATEHRFRLFNLFGQYDTQHQILLDSMMHQGKAGFQILTPLLNGKTAILVNRGWFPQAADRMSLPDISVSGEPRQIEGRLTLLPRPGLVLPADPVDDNSPWPRRLLYPTATEIEQHLGYPVYDYQILLTDNSDPGFIRDWRPEIPGPEKNVGYAIQWFSFTLAIFAIYLILNLRQPLHRMGG